MEERNSNSFTTYIIQRFVPSLLLRHLLIVHFLVQEEVILKLDIEPEVFGVTCNEKLIAVEVKPGQTSLLNRMRNVTLIAGGRVWGCENVEGKPVSILVRVINIVNVSQEARTIVFNTTKATYTEFFKHAHVNFNAASFPANHFLTQAHPPGTSTTRRQGHLSLRRGFFSWIADRCADVAKAALVIVATVVNVFVNNPTVREILKGHDVHVQCTGSDCHITGWSFQPEPFTIRGSGAYDSEDSAPADANVTCSNCSAEADVNLIYDLHINHLELQGLTVAVSGRTELNVNAQASFRGNGDYNTETLINTIHMAPVEFAVFGIPVIIDLSVPIKAGYSASVEVEGDVAVQASAFGHLEYGVKYSKRDGWGFINQFEHGYSGGLNHGTMDMKLSVQVYLIPIVVMRIEHVGGPTLSVKPWVELMVDAEMTTQQKMKKSDAKCPNGNTIKGAINWGIQCGLGAKIDIGLFGPLDHMIVHDFGHTIFLNIKKPIASGCLALPQFANNNNLASHEAHHAPPHPRMPIVAGTVWYGSASRVAEPTFSNETKSVQTPTCDDRIRYELTVQASTDPDCGQRGCTGDQSLQNGRFVGANSYVIPGSHSCVVQSQRDMTIGSMVIVTDGKGGLVPAETPNNQKYRQIILRQNMDNDETAYQKCNLNSTMFKPNLETVVFTGNMSLDFNHVEANPMITPTTPGL